GAAQAPLEALQPVVTSEAAAEPALHLAEGQVDLVVQDDHAVQRRLERPARRPDAVAGGVHVGLRQQDRHAGPAGARAPFGDQTTELPLGARQLPAAGELLTDLEADVVATAGVLPA